jgi:synaptosomal-associated protein 29
MAGHNYLSDPKNPFFSLEDDVDDETFLRSAPPRYPTPTAYNNGINHYKNSDNELEQKHQELVERKKAIEARTIKSSERSISLLRDTEEVGTATAEVSYYCLQNTFITSLINSINKFYIITNQILV